MSDESTTTNAVYEEFQKAIKFSETHEVPLLHAFVNVMTPILDEIAKELAKEGTEAYFIRHVLLSHVMELGYYFGHMHGKAGTPLTVLDEKDQIVRDLP